ncbi:MAG: hypothetical protein QM296_11950 [Bacillota bacterium]|nr:hypothetical protein [Bacillota bacterium]
MTDERGDLTALLTGEIDALRRNWQTLRQSLGHWDLKRLEQSRSRIVPIVADLSDNWELFALDAAAEEAQIRATLASPDYAAALEAALEAAGVPFSGEFPEYMLPPYKLTIQTENGEARLSLGRRSERSSELEPGTLANWVRVRYQRVTSRRFNANALMRDLLDCYRMAFAIQYPEQVREEMQKPADRAGLAVPLQLIYQLLTLRATSRQEYPRQFFLYDLGLLTELPELVYRDYRFELGFARNLGVTMVIVDSQGREQRYSSLTVHKEATE